MFDQPDINAYISYGDNYSLYMAFILLLGVITAYVIQRFKRGTNDVEGVPLPPVWLIIVIGLAVRVPLMFHNMWYDETFTSAVVQTDTLTDMMRVIRGDVHPPGYYLIVRIFTDHLGHNDIAMRLPALLSGLGLILAMYYIGKQHGDHRIGQWSAMITAVLPATTYYSAEARYPAFLALMLALSYIGVRKKHGLIVGVAMSAAAFAHVNAYIYIGILGLYWLITTGKIKPLILPALSIGVWLPIVMQQAQDVADGFWLQQYPVYRHVIEMTISTRFYGAAMGLIPMVFAMALVWVAVWKWRKDATWLWLIVAVGVPFGQWFVGAVWNPIYLPRTLMFSALLLVIPVAWYLEDNAPRWVIGAAAIACMAGIGSMYIAPDRAHYGNDAVAACGDLPVYATNTHTGIIAKRYTTAPVSVYIHGNSTAQQLPLDSRLALFDRVDTSPHAPVCVISQVSVFNEDIEMQHLEAIARQADTIELIHNDKAEIEFGYYAVLRIEDKNQ